MDPREVVCLAILFALSGEGGASRLPEHPRPLDVAIAALAIFRACRFLSEDGFPPVKRLRDGIRDRYGPDSPWTEILSCPWCQSLWISPLVALSIKRYPRVRWLLLGPALSGVVGLLSTADSALSRIGTTSPEKEWERVGPGEWRRSASL
jgi:hypothetical protein